MKKVILFIIMFLSLGCESNETEYSNLMISCEKVYFFYDKETETAYHYYLFGIRNNSDENLVLKRNVMRNNKPNDDLEALELIFRVNEDTLRSNFVDSWFMFNKDFILWKNKANKVIYYLESYKTKLIEKEIYIKSLKGLYNDTLYYNKAVDTLQQRLSIDDALLLIKT